MDEIFGNDPSKENLRKFITSGLFPMLVHGQYGIGKCSQVKNFFGTDYRIVDCSQGIEEIKEMFTEMVSGRVILDNFSSINVLTQDFFLKKLEESVFHFVAISHDNGSLNDAILSRFRAKVGFNRLSESILRGCGFSPAEISISDGSYLVAMFLKNFPEYCDWFTRVKAKEDMVNKWSFPNLKHDIYKTEIAMVHKNILKCLARSVDKGFYSVYNSYSRTPSLSLELHMKSVI